MRLNRVLLLAASINMAMLATVFTISCSGDDGKSGAPGASCTVVQEEGGANVTCGSSTVFIPSGSPGLQGPPGLNGSGTAVGACNVQRNVYNDYELAITCPNIAPATGSTTEYVCSGIYFDPASHFCTNGTERDVDAGTAEGGIARTVYNAAVTGQILKKFTCTVSSESISYSPNEQFCQGNGGTPEVFELFDICGKGDYNGNQKFCQEYSNGFRSTEWLCGDVDGSSQPYAPSQFCRRLGGISSLVQAKEGVIEDRCGGSSEYVTDAVTGELQGVFGIEVSGSSTADGTYATNYEVINEDGDGVVSVIVGEIPDRTYCQNGNVMRECKIGTTASGAPTNALFNIATQFCQNPNGTGTVKDLCGTRMYNDGGIEGSTRCNNGRREVQCNNGLPLSAENPALFYNDSTHFCRKKSDPAFSGIAEEANIGEICKTATGVEITKPVPGNQYDGVQYFCENNKIVTRCGTASYDPSSEFCSASNTVHKFCKDYKDTNGNLKVYDPNNLFCSYSYELEDQMIKVINTALPICASTSPGPLYNVAAWDWDYCVDSGNSIYDGEVITANTRVIRCLAGQKPSGDDLSLCKDICAENSPGPGALIYFDPVIKNCSATDPNAAVCSPTTAGRANCNASNCATTGAGWWDASGTGECVDKTTCAVAGTTWNSVANDCANSCSTNGTTSCETCPSSNLYWNGSDCADSYGCLSGESDDGTGGSWASPSCS